MHGTGGTVSLPLLKPGRSPSSSSCDGSDSISIPEQGRKEWQGAGCFRKGEQLVWRAAQGILALSRHWGPVQSLSCRHWACWE